MNKTKQPGIIPAPQIEEITSGNFSLSGKLNLYVSDNAELSSVVYELHKSIESKSKVSFTEIDYPENAKIIFMLQKDLDFSDYKDSGFEEAYLLDIDKENITIKARTNRALFYGAMSLVQLIEMTNNNLIKCRRIIDWPDMDIRGISDDISRGQVSTLDNFKRIIRFIAKYKMNTYMPYLEDMLKFDSYPNIGVGRGALTKEEVKEIVAFAGKYFIDVVPVFQTLGHYENILSLPEFVKYAEFPGAASLSVSEDATYEFLETMLKEVFEMFPSKYFHMGADESWDVGLGKSKEITEATSLADVHAKHYNRVYDICKKYNKEVLMYGDIILHHPEILEKIPNDITIVDWHYSINFDYPSAKTFNEAGFNYIVSPSVWNFLTTYPVYVNSVPNIKNIVKSGLAHKSIGMINSNWGDYGAETIKELILPSYAWSAQCSWSFDKSKIDDFNYSFFSNFFATTDEAPLRVHNILSNQFNQMLWHDVWRHPLLSFRDPAWWEPRISPAARVEWMRSSLRELRNEIIQMKISVKSNAEYISILEFLTDFNEWYLLKVETQSQLLQTMKNSKSGLDFLEAIEMNIASLKELKPRYKEIWTHYYKPNNLNMIEDKFDRLVAYFEETSGQIKNGSLKSPELTSKWIYCPVGEENYSPKAEFTNTIEVDGEIESAKLQLLGDTYVKLFINDEFVEDVYVRRSLSLYGEYKRIKYLDVAKYLKTGENNIRVVAESFNSKPYAGVNIIGQIETTAGTLSFESNEEWKTRDLTNDGEWISAKSKDYRFTVIQPDFKTNRTSWIER